MRPDWFERDIIAPASEGERSAVRLAQRVLRVDVTGEMDAATRSALRGAQYLYGVPVTGILDEKTAVVIDGMRPYSLREDE
jgi:putative peptidoglycan binding protein